MEIKANLTVTLDASPALLGAMECLADRMKGGERNAKPRTRASKAAEEEQPVAETEKASEATHKPAETEGTAAVETPAAAAEPADRMGAEGAREVLMNVVQQYGCPDKLREKMLEMGYEEVPAMPADVRAKFIEWVKQTYPVKVQ